MRCGEGAGRDCRRLTDVRVTVDCFLFGYEIFNSFNFRQGDRNSKVKFHYAEQLDGKDKAERFAGKLPEAGFVFSNLPMRGLWHLVGIVRLSNKFDHDDGDKLRQELINMPPISIRKL